jgi:hypothetical protein
MMKQMGVSDGEGITFKHFWGLIQSLATTQHDLISKKVSKSSCVLL